MNSFVLPLPGIRILLNDARSVRSNQVSASDNPWEDAEVIIGYDEMVI